MLLYQILHSQKNMNISYKNNKFKTKAPIRNKEFELPDWSYSASDIQDNFEHVFKKKTKNP